MPAVPFLQKAEEKSHSVRVILQEILNLAIGILERSFVGRKPNDSVEQRVIF